jgi:hypothetical protein
MRRKEKEITAPAEIEAVIARAELCHLAMCDGDRPYAVPMSFGFDGQAFYFHSAPEGRKIELLSRNPEVCIALETDVSLSRAEKACRFGAGYRSVIAFGRAEFVDAPEEKRRALDLIMAHYAPGEAFDYEEGTLARTRVIRVAVSRMTGKRS